MPNQLRRFTISNKLYRPDLVRSSRETLQAIVDHMEYIQGYRESGEVVLAGGFTDGSGGMDIIEVATLEQALEIADNDPLRIANLATQEIRELQTDSAARKVQMKQAIASLG